MKFPTNPATFPTAIKTTDTTGAGKPIFQYQQSSFVM